MRCFLTMLHAMMRIRPVGALAYAVCALPVGAQAVPKRVVDTRLRIETHQGALWTGRVVGVGRDSVFLREDHQRAIVAIARHDVRRMEESAGVRRSRGAKRGALVGGVLGVALIAVAAQIDASHSNDGPGVRYVAVPGALGVTLLGTGLGAAFATERWRAPQEFRISRGVGRAESRSIALSFRIPFQRR